MLEGVGGESGGGAGGEESGGAGAAARGGAGGGGGGGGEGGGGRVTVDVSSVDESSEYSESESGAALSSATHTL